MCFNTTSILYDCNKNLTKKTMIIFVFSGLFMILSLICTLVFWFSKPVWLPEEIKRNNLRNNIEDEDTDDELINIDDNLMDIVNMERVTLL